MCRLFCIRHPQRPTGLSVSTVMDSRRGSSKCEWAQWAGACLHSAAGTPKPLPVRHYTYCTYLLSYLRPSLYSVSRSLQLTNCKSSVLPTVTYTCLSLRTLLRFTLQTSAVQFLAGGWARVASIQVVVLSLCVALVLTINVRELQT